jgi:hypothetical protein
MGEEQSGLPRRIFGTVFLLSLGVLMLQIALNRIFSFTIWYHFAYISVSLALLGFGASGSMLAAFPRLGGERIRPTIGLYCGLSAATTLVMLIVIGSVPLNPFEAIQSRTGLGTFVLYFSIVSIPFFFAGMAITIALRAAGREVNRLYFWDLVGAGLGCALVVLAIDWLETPRVVVLVALIFTAAGLVASAGERSPALTLNLVTGALLLLVIGPLPKSLPFTPSNDKELADWLRVGVTHYSKWGSIFRTDLVGDRGREATLGGYRQRGISPHYEGEFPPYRVIVHDAGAAAIMYQVRDGMKGLEMFQHHVLTAPYVVRDHPDVLIIGVGGGLDVIVGLENGAKHVTGVELNPVAVDLLTHRYRDYTGGLYDRPDIEIHSSEGRHFVRMTDERFDLIQITGVDTLAAMSTGAYILSENYLYTVDAYREYFRVLRADGVHSIATLDFHPRLGYPRHALRFSTLSYEALRLNGVARPNEHIMVVATDQPVEKVEILTKMQPFSEAEIAAMEQFIDKEGFQAWYLPGRPDRQQQVFRTLLEGTPEQRQRFFNDSFLDLRPTTDDRPFFFSYYKWRHLFEHRKEIDQRNTLATGQLVLAFILALAILFSVVAIALPMIRVRGGASTMPGRWGFLAYFAALGVGFIFAEISFVQRFILFLGYPTYSLTVTLFSFLTAAGIGAHLSGRLRDNPARTLPVLVLTLTAVVAVETIALPSIMEALLAASLAVRIVATVLLCAPLGGVLGMFFPYGIRLTTALNRDFVAWAWAVNGCLTVVGSVLAIILAMSYGFTVVSVVFVAVYWLGAASFVRTYASVRA